MTDSNQKMRRVRNKEMKEANLIEAAYELFLTKGVHETAINDIVKKAGLAKGTFYLYFKDKPHILDILILRKSYIVLKQALHQTIAQNKQDYIEEVVYFVEYIIDYFKNNVALLKLIDKNLSWGIFRKALHKEGQYKEMRELAQRFMDSYCQSQGKTAQQASHTLFIIVELVGSVLGSCIINNEPTDIDTIKPVLIESVRKILN